MSTTDTLMMLCLLVWLVSFTGMLFGSALSFRALNHKKKLPGLGFDQDYAPVSILKPLKGVDKGIEENLRSFFELDYPQYELLFCVADKSDPCIPIVRRLIRTFPQVQARLFIGAEDLGANPKVNNLNRAYQFARHELILISDSNIRALPYYLKDLVARLSSDVGLVTSVVIGSKGEGLGGLLEEVGMNSLLVRISMLASYFDRTIVLGKSMLLRRSDLHRIGGLKFLSSYIAEDYIAGQAIRGLGLKIVAAPEVLPQHLGKESIQFFWSRYVRWARIRKAHTPFLFYVEPLHSCFVAGFLGAVSLGFWTGLSSVYLFLVHSLIWMLCDFVLVLKLSEQKKWKLLGAWLLRESSALALWIHAASRNQIYWRNKALYLKRGGQIAAPTHEDLPS